MVCFNHADTPAVAICKSCNRGLCTACAVPVGNGIACRDQCEDDVAGLNSVLARNVQANSQSGSAWSATSGLYSLMGILFGVWGWTSNLVPLILLGAAMLAYGLFLGWRGRAITRAG